MAPSM